jgi:hypothetical protein
LPKAEFHPSNENIEQLSNGNEKENSSAKRLSRIGCHADSGLDAASGFEPRSVVPDSSIQIRDQHLPVLSPLIAAGPLHSPGKS